MDASMGAVEFYGVVDRVGQGVDGLSLRVYPFEFDTAPDARPVLAVRFEDPAFAAGDASALIGIEVEVLVCSDRAELHDVFSASTTVLRAGRVVSDSVAYDREDLLGRVRQIDGEMERLNAALMRMVAKDRKGEALTRELLRRAQIKAAASADLEMRHAAAVAVLERLVRHFDEDG